MCPEDIADVVNLGLIPSSEPGWIVACRALKSDGGGLLLVHGNINSKSNVEDYRTGYNTNHSRMVVSEYSSTEALDIDDVVLSPSEYHSTGETVDQKILDMYVCKSYIEWPSVSPPGQEYACYVAQKIDIILHVVRGDRWTCQVVHVEHVKCFAPHVDHLVVDIQCSPVR